MKDLTEEKQRRAENGVLTEGKNKSESTRQVDHDNDDVSTKREKTWRIDISWIIRVNRWLTRKKNKPMLLYF